MKRVLPVVLAFLLGAAAFAVAGEPLLWRDGILNRLRMSYQGGAAPPAPGGADAVLMQDGSSYVLQQDATSKVLKQ